MCVMCICVCIYIYIYIHTFAGALLLPNHRRRNLKAFEEHAQKHVPCCFITG